MYELADERFYFSYSPVWGLYIIKYFLFLPWHHPAFAEHHSCCQGCHYLFLSANEGIPPSRSGLLTLGSHDILAISSAHPASGPKRNENTNKYQHCSKEYYEFTDNIFYLDIKIYVENC